MSRGALLLHEIFLEKFEDLELDPDYVTGIKSNIHDSYRNLFAGVMIQSIRDLIDDRCKQSRATAREWLNGPNTHLFSFRNICAVLDLDAQKVREKIKAHISRKPIGAHKT